MVYTITIKLYLKSKDIMKIPKMIIDRVNAINAMLPDVESADTIPSTYGGSTMESDIELTKPIEIKGQYVYIYENQHRHSYGFHRRYNTNRRDIYDYKGLSDLKYDLGIIIKAFKKTLK